MAGSEYGGRSLGGQEEVQDGFSVPSLNDLGILLTRGPLLIALQSRPGWVEWVNAYTAEFFGRPLDSFLGTGWLDLFHPQDRIAIAANIDAPAPTDDVQQRIYRVRSVTEEYVPVLVTSDIQSLPGHVRPLYVTVTIPLQPQVLQGVHLHEGEPDLQKLLRQCVECGKLEGEPGYWWPPDEYPAWHFTLQFSTCPNCRAARQS